MSQQTRAPKFEIVELDGHPFGSSDNRVLGILDSEGERFFNLDEEFDKSSPDIQKGINTALEMWKQNQHKPKRHHGWTATQHGGKYVNCYVFKHTAQQARVFGYVFHPPQNNRVVLCCLMHYATKNEDSADTTILDELVRFGNTAEVVNAVELFYKEQLQTKEAKL